GFVGNLDQLVPDLMNDPIYGTERLHKQSKAKDLGNLKAGDAGGDDQYKWWNSETQSNWWDGYIRNAFLLDDQKAIEKVKNYINRILATQDEDGYIGIYDKELRYKFTGENGELWSKTTLYRGLLAYYEYTHDENVWNALVRAVDNVMQNYPINQSQPFFAGKDFSGGVAHGLTFTDILDRMYQLTGNQKYWDYAAFLYLNFSENYSSENDAQLSNILDPGYKLQSHGVHTYEHLRPIILAGYVTGRPDLKKALQIYLERINKCTTPTGGAIGDEWIGGRQENATHTGYEYCSLQELMDSYSVLFQKSGDIKAAEEIETIFYNAAQGSRNPKHSCIAYLKTDNSYEMMGTRNGEVEPDRKQTRYKYSPVHQDVAVCCVPNAGRISPYFLQNCWLKEGENTLVAAVLSPNILETTIQNIPVTIEEITEYPYRNHLIFKIKTGETFSFQLKIRKPEWAKSIQTKEKYRIEGEYLVFDREFLKNDQIELELKAEVQVKEDLNHEKYFSYGALVYAKPIAVTEQKGKIYSPGFEDLTYSPLNTSRYEFIRNHQARFQDGNISVNLKNKTTQKTEKLDLIPLGKTILRQVSFQ
ncbi:MAG: beta-L-arabinofuranosidase domain-containing protein, partial [Bacteroidota bacterium]